MIERKLIEISKAINRFVAAMNFVGTLRDATIKLDLFVVLLDVHWLLAPHILALLFLA